jgi:hypothetical protein
MFLVQKLGGASLPVNTLVKIKEGLLRQRELEIDRSVIQSTEEEGHFNKQGCTESLGKAGELIKAGEKHTRTILGGPHQNQSYCVGAANMSESLCTSLYFTTVSDSVRRSRKSIVRESVPSLRGVIAQGKVSALSSLI